MLFFLCTLRAGGEGTFPANTASFYLYIKSNNWLDDAQTLCTLTNILIEHELATSVFRSKQHYWETNDLTDESNLDK